MQKQVEKKKYYVVRERAVPEVLLKVVEAKRLLESKRVATVQEAAERTGISRSSFYKYKDDIFPFHEETKGKTITFIIQMDDEPGLLSMVLQTIARFHGNILTIHQSIPINGVATLTLSVDILPGDMILVTHSRDEAYKFCRELSIVHEGRILVTGETKQLFERPGLLEAAKLTGCKNFSRAERLGPHEIYAADWKMKLHTEENVDEDITHVGIRGHWIRPESKPGENCMAVRVDQYIETTFEHQYMIRNKAEENAAGLWWMRPKNSFTEDPDKDLPEYLYFPPEHLMLLK